MVIADGVLRDLVAQGLTRHAAFSLDVRDDFSVSGAADQGRDGPVLLFDMPHWDGFCRAADDLFARHAALTPFCLDLKEKSAASHPRLPAQNIFLCPLRMGVLLDVVNRHAGGKAAVLAAGSLSIGAYELLPEQNILRKADGTVINLTEKERDILLCLHRTKGVTVDRHRLLDQIWAYAANVETHTLETHIYRLRQKIEDDPARPQYILTDGAGYRLCLDDN